MRGAKVRSRVGNREAFINVFRIAGICCIGIDCAQQVQASQMVKCI